jgi:hypothetical protein
MPAGIIRTLFGFVNLLDPDRRIGIFLMSDAEKEGRWGQCGPELADLWWTHGIQTRDESRRQIKDANGATLFP